MTSTKQYSLKIDPRNFISAPYVNCPKCNQESFGVLSIFGSSYTRRCRECLFPNPQQPTARFSLPKLNKRVIYLDQNVISNMMKALNPETGAHKRCAVPLFWKELFEKVDELTKLQLIICPDSDFHRHESLLSQYYGALQKMYELLSHGVSFYDHNTIHRFQLISQFKKWRREQTTPVDVHRVVHGHINEWQERFIFSIPIRECQELLDELRSNKDMVLKELLPVFRRWQSEKDKNFNFWYKEEIKGHAELVLSLYNRQLSNYALAHSGISIDPGLLLPDMSTILIHQMKKILRNQNVSESQLNSTIIEFLKSREFYETPYIKLASMIWASVAKKAASGQKKPPNRGFMIDVNIISTLLPYCNAMFIDDACRSYLEEKPLKDEVQKYNVKIFSNKKNKEFFRFLDGIKDDAPASHFEKIKEVYGPDWSKPYVELYR